MICAINLMTPTARRREIYRLRLRQWLRISSAALLILTLVTIGHYYCVRQTLQEQQLLETTLEPINHLKEANKRLAKQIAAFREKEQFVLPLLSRQPTVTLLGMLGTAVSNVGDRVFLERMELVSSERTANAQTESPIIVKIMGLANNNSTVSLVAEEIQTSIPSGKVDVTANNESRIRDQLVHDFTLHCTFQN